MVDNDISKMLRKLDTISSLLATLKLDMDDVKERLKEINPGHQVDALETIPIPFPLQTLTDIENLEVYLKSKPEAKIVFVSWSLIMFGINQQQ